jgi:hypothetical protein
LLLAHVSGDRLVVDHGVFDQTDLHLGDLLGADHRTLGIGRDLCLVVTDVVSLAIGYRLAFDAHFPTGHRHGHVLVLGDDVLAQTGLAGGDLVGADSSCSSERDVSTTSDASVRFGWVATSYSLSQRSPTP